MSAYSMIGYGMIVSIEDKEHPDFDYIRFHRDIKSYVVQKDLKNKVNINRDESSFAALAETLRELLDVQWPELTVIAPGSELDLGFAFMIVVKDSVVTHFEGTYALELNQVWPVWTREEEILQEVRQCFLPEHDFGWHISIINEN